MTTTNPSEPEQVAQLLVAPAHRADCTFGSGFFRIVFKDGTRLWRDNQEQVEHIASLVDAARIERVDRDGYCLDGMRVGDANTPDVIDAETWLAMPREQAMAEAGLFLESDYARVYRQVSDAVYTRANREKQGGVHVPIVIKKRGRPVIDISLEH